MAIFHRTDLVISSHSTEGEKTISYSQINTICIYHHAPNSRTVLLHDNFIKNMLFLRELPNGQICGMTNNLPVDR